MQKFYPKIYAVWRKRNLPKFIEVNVRLPGSVQSWKIREIFVQVIYSQASAEDRWGPLLSVQGFSIS
jgi:hypothetical protein